MQLCRFLALYRRERASSAIMSELQFIYQSDIAVHPYGGGHAVLARRANVKSLARQHLTIREHAPSLDVESLPLD